MTVSGDRLGTRLPDCDNTDPASLEAWYKRFWSYVRTGPGCWEWQGALDGKGYGQIKFPRQRRQARTHRVAYALRIGPIAEGMEVCHSCDNPKCCNPAHLYLATHRQNIRDASAHGLMARDVCRNGHPRTAENTITERGRRRCGICQRAAAAAFRARRKAA